MTNVHVSLVGPMLKSSNLHDKEDMHVMPNVSLPTSDTLPNKERKAFRKAMEDHFDDMILDSFGELNHLNDESLIVGFVAETPTLELQLDIDSVTEDYYNVCLWKTEHTNPDHHWVVAEFKIDR